MKVALYARVSTSDKDQDPETQLYALREFTRAQGWTVDKEYVDYVAGSGTTLLAAHSLGRRAYGVEIDQERYLAAKNRIFLGTAREVPQQIKDFTTQGVLTETHLRKITDLALCSVRSV
jgi:predicted RNA methylase